MKQPTIVKPQLNVAQALAFATGTAQNKNEGTDKGKGKKTAQRGLNEGKKVQSGLVPENDVRLTANIRKDLHLKLKIAAAEQSTTIGELIEALIDKHL
jgi:hypothetical protein